MERSGQDKIRYPSPLYLFAIIGGTIFIAEAAIMSLFHYFHLHENSFFIEIIDPVLLILCVFPALYFFLYKPQKRQVDCITRAKEDLKRSELRLSMALEQSRIGVFELDLVRKKTWRSPWHHRIFGYEMPPEEWDADTFLRHIVEEDRDIMEAKLRRAMTTGADIQHECRIIHKDGTPHWVSIKAHVYLNEKNMPALIIGVIMDVTERKMMEEQLRDFNSVLEEKVDEQTSELIDINLQLEKEVIKHMETLVNLEASRTLTTAIIDSVENGIIACNLEGRPILFNMTMKKILGLPQRPEGEGEWSRYCDIYLADGKMVTSREELGLYKALAGIETTNEEITIAPKSAPRRNILSTGRQLVTKDGKKIGAVVSLFDITLRKEMEARIKENEMLLVQQSKMASMGEMISAIAHQWKQPLNALALLIQDLEDAHQFGELDDKYFTDAVKQSMSQVQYMSKTIDDFRNFYKASKNKEVFNIVNAVKDAINLQSAQLKNSQIEVRINSKTTQSLSTTGYPSEFKQVILNIISNARNAIIEAREEGLLSREDNEIEINISQEDDRVIVNIVNHGKPIPEEIMGRIFDPYFTTRDTGEGTGIGLYMSKTIIEKNMGGKIYAHNIDHGVNFTIELHSN